MKIHPTESSCSVTGHRELLSRPQKVRTRTTLSHGSAHRSRVAQARFVSPIHIRLSRRPLRSRVESSMGLDNGTLAASDCSSTNAFWTSYDRRLGRRRTLPSPALTRRSGRILTRTRSRPRILCNIECSPHRKYRGDSDG